jgi:hypothetical protein
MMMIDLDKEMAWITFVADGFESKWYPVLCPISGRHLEFDDSIMDHCRAQFNNPHNKVYFGIAQTSQMLMGNSVRDNL